MPLSLFNFDAKIIDSYNYAAIKSLYFREIDFNIPEFFICKYYPVKIQK